MQSSRGQQNDVGGALKSILVFEVGRGSTWGGGTEKRVGFIWRQWGAMGEFKAWERSEDWDFRKIPDCHVVMNWKGCKLEAGLFWGE